MSTVPIPKLLANFETSLAGTMSASATSLTLNRSTDNDGTTLSGLYSLTFDEGTTTEEHMTVTLTGASGTVSRRGLSRVDGYTEVTANKFRHERGGSVKITSFALLNIQRLLNGTDTFNAVDLLGINSITGLATPTSGETTKAANVAYVNAVSIAGASDASETAKGIVEMGTAAQATAGTATGETGAPLTLTPARIAAQIQSGSWLYAVEDGTGSDDTYTAALTPALPAYTAGQMFAVKLTVANTGACTINFNGLGAKNIKKYASGAQADPETGDIVANMPCIFLYDGTSMILMNPGATMPTTALLSEMAAFFNTTTATGSQVSTLVAGATSDADAFHTHKKLRSAKITVLAVPYPGVSSGGVAVGSWYDTGGSNPNFLSIACAQDSAGGGFGYASWSHIDEASSVLEDASDEIFLYNNPAGYSVANWTLASGGIIRVPDGSHFISETSGGSINYNNTTSVTFSGTGASGSLSYDYDNSYVLILHSATKIRRYTHSTSTLTYVDEITLTSSVDIDKAFFFDSASDTYFFNSGTSIKTFNSSGTLQNTYSHGISASSLLGVAGIGRTLYVAIREGYGSSSASADPDISIAVVRFLPTTLTY